MYFARKGYEKTSITDIANEMGVSQGLCYRYYPSKEAMYDEAIEEYASYIVQTNIEKMDITGLTLKEQILKMSGSIGKYTSAEHGKNNLYELFHKEGNKKLHNELFLRTGEKMVPVIADILEVAKKRGELHITDTKTLAHFFVFGQMSVLLSNEYTQEEKQSRIQSCLIELLNL